MLIIGDMNRAVGCGKEGVEGNKSLVSYGGSMIRDLIGSGDYFLLNNMSLTMGGPWTRICPGNGSPSCLDLVIGSSNLRPYIRAMKIDSGRMFTPRRTVAKKTGIGVVYTDHYPTLVEVEMPVAEQNSDTIKPTWNTQKPGGWDRYTELSNKVAEEIELLVEEDKIEDEELMVKVDKIQTKLKFTAFGKTKPQTKSFKKRRESSASKTESDEAKELVERQVRRMEDHISQVKKAEKGRVNKIFKMKDIVAGSKKAAPEAQAIKNPETNELVVSNSEIKRVTLKYCLKTLENNPGEGERAC